MSNSKTKPLKILAVDDEPLIRKSLQMAGESRGHTVKTAENGKTALHLWPSFDPDVAFIDIVMPEMDGLELLRQIPTHSRARKILLSAQDMMSEKELLDKGADLFVKKPFENIFELIKRAEELVTNKK